MATFANILIVKVAQSSMEFSRPEYWSGQLFPSLGDHPNPGIKPRSPTLQAKSLLAEPQRKLMHSSLTSSSFRILNSSAGIPSLPLSLDGASLMPQRLSVCLQCGRPVFNPGSGRSPGEGNGNPLQYSYLENSMDRGAWQATVHGVTRSRTRLSN